MFDQAFIKQLKQVNIGNKEQTPERVRGLWKNASPDQQKDILDLAGLSKNTVMRACRDGSISAKLVVAIAQVLSVNPYFLVGKSDDPMEFSDKTVRAFLIGQGYGKLLGVQKKAGRKPRKPRQPAVAAVKEKAKRAPRATATAKETVKETVKRAPRAAKAAVEDKPSNAAVVDLSDEEALALFRALRIRSGLGVSSAKEKLAQIQRLLMD